MGYSVEHNLIKTSLMDGVIRVVSEEGFDKATTRAITKNMNGEKINDAYIYRYFHDKEDLFSRTFLRADVRFIKQLENITDELTLNNELSPKEKCRKLWNSVWNFILNNASEFVFYLQYYYSPYFKGDIISEHMSLYDNFHNKFHKYVPEAVHIKEMMHRILEFALSLIAKIKDPYLDRSSEQEERNFELVWQIVNLYIK